MAPEGGLHDADAPFMAEPALASTDNGPAVAWRAIILVDRLYPLQLEAKRVISALPAAAVEYRAGALQLYRDAAPEGVAP